MVERRVEDRGNSIFARMSVFLAVVLVSQLPLCLAAILVRCQLPFCYTIAMFSAAVLMIAAPLMAAKRCPRLARFDVKLVPCNVRKTLLSLLGVPLLVCCFSVLAIVAGGILLALGLWKGREGWLVHGTVPVGRALVITQAALNMVLVPVAQEFFWRGYALSWLKKMMPWVWAVVIQAILFSLSHCFPVDASVVSFMFGGLFGYWAHRSGHLLTVTLAHITWNVMVYGSLYMTILQHM